MRVDLLRLSPGLSVALSRFAAGTGMEDLVRWPPGRLLMAFNIAGSMAIRDAEGVTHPIRNGEGWVLHTGSDPLTRIMHPGQNCSNLVVEMESEAVSPRLRALILRELPQEGMVRSFRLSRPARHLPGSFFDGNASPAALLRKEGDGLTLIGQVFEELETQGESEPLPEARLLEARILVQRIEALLRDRLSETLLLYDLALTLGVSHVTLRRVAPAGDRAGLRHHYAVAEWGMPGSCDHAARSAPVGGADFAGAGGSCRHGGARQL